MNSLFFRPQSLGVRLFFAVLFSVILIFTDGRSQAVKSFRNILESFSISIYYVASTPQMALDSFGRRFIDSEKLLLENKNLKALLREKNSELLKMQNLKATNDRLSILLGSPIKEDELKKVTKVIISQQNKEHQQLIINKGRLNNVFIGQPLIDEQGIVGQVIATSEISSRVLLISDSSSSIPVQVLRSNVRALLDGNDSSNELIIKNLTKDQDIKVGDLLVTSGIGGRFPEGYPIATVTEIESSQTSPFLMVKAKPSASLNHLDYLLLVWTSGDNVKTIDTLSPENVKQVASLRSNFISPLHYLNRKNKNNAKWVVYKEEKKDDINIKQEQVQ